MLISKAYVLYNLDIVVYVLVKISDSIIHLIVSILLTEIICIIISIK